MVNSKMETKWSYVQINSHGFISPYLLDIMSLEEANVNNSLIQLFTCFFKLIIFICIRGLEFIKKKFLSLTSLIPPELTWSNVSFHYFIVEIVIS